jgi:hypothetical protein
MRNQKLTARFVSTLVCAISCVSIVGCGPRGEAHTIDQILTDARGGYESVANKVPANDGATIKTLTANIDKVAGIGGGGDARTLSSDIASQLEGLSVRAGFTARPAMAELINQYRNVAADKGATVSIGAPHLKLLAARTYSLLTAELNTTQFRL